MTNKLSKKEDIAYSFRFLGIGMRKDGMFSFSPRIWKKERK